MFQTHIFGALRMKTSYIVTIISFFLILAQVAPMCGPAFDIDFIENIATEESESDEKESEKDKVASTAFRSLTIEDQVSLHHSEHDFRLLPCPYLVTISPPPDCA
jgi:hypothetical protein